MSNRLVYLLFLMFIISMTVVEFWIIYTTSSSMEVDNTVNKTQLTINQIPSVGEEIIDYGNAYHLYYSGRVGNIVMLTLTKEHGNVDKQIPIVFELDNETTIKLFNTTITVYLEDDIVKFRLVC